MKNSSIQWCDHTFNPWEGCAKVAAECKNCYAEVLVDQRFGRAKWGKGQPRRRTSEATWKQPLKWNRDLDGGFGQHRRARVFCLSLGDWLDDEVPIEWLADLLALIHATPNLDWLLLTKRPENWRERIEEALTLWEDAPAENADEVSEFLAGWLDCLDMPERGAFPENVWIGVSAGADQEAALKIPAKIHFLSCEPMLHGLDTAHAAKFDWIIFGGESGRNARVCNVEWIRNGLKFCRAHGIAGFVKQLGRRPVGRTQGVVTWPLYDLLDSHGGDWSEWPEDLRVREFPAG